MNASIEYFLIYGALLLIAGVAASKLSDRFGIPALLLFLGIGMLAGSDGPGGIYFDDPLLAQNLGTIALVVILFSGGLDTSWKSIRPVIKEGILLATLGVFVTAGVMGLIIHWLLRISLLEGMLIGAIISSTDAAAVFSILRSRGIRLKGKLQPLLELESGSNDPMAVFLTIGLAQLILNPQQGILALVWMFIRQVGIGLALGILFGKGTLLLLNRLRLNSNGLNPVLTIAASFLAFGLTNVLGGSGFLAVYVAGVVMGREDFLHKRSILAFYDGLAWLMQIVMFLVLGLLVFPSHISAVVLPGLAVALGLVFIARPLAVMLSLSLTQFKFNEKVFISWVGLRGAVPIILATYPRVMGIQPATDIFNIVFFVVILSVLLQGSTMGIVARRLKLISTEESSQAYPLQLVSGSEWKGTLKEMTLPEDSWAIGKAIYELGLPDQYLVVLISRHGDFIVPNGGLILEPNDKMLGLALEDIHDQVERLCRSRNALVNE